MNFDDHFLRGGAGGASAATRQKRDEKDLLKGLHELLPNPKTRKQDTLLEALRKLIDRAANNPDELLSQLTNLVKAASEGKIPLGPKAPTGKGRATTGSGKGKGTAKPKAQPEPTGNAKGQANGWTRVQKKRPNKQNKQQQTKTFAQAVAEGRGRPGQQTQPVTSDSQYGSVKGCRALNLLIVTPKT